MEIKNLLLKYDLEDPIILLENPVKKEEWKRTINKAINFIGSSISIPYNNIGSTYVLKRCKEVSASSPLCPCNPEAIRL
jgi:hypothetical protein